MSSPNSFPTIKPTSIKSMTKTITTTTTTTLYALGSNGSGQLGVGHNRDISVAERCRFLISSSSPYPTTTNNNNRGGSEDEEIDTNTTNADTSSSLSLLSIRNDKIKKIVAGGNHTLILTESGGVYATGEDWDGRCGFGIGFGFGGSTTTTPTPINENGYENGNSDTKMRNGKSNDIFRRVEFPFQRSTSTSELEEGKGKITNIAATWEASFFVVDDLVVYSCGSGGKGELGLGREVDNVECVTICFDVRDIKDHSSRPELYVKSITGSMSHVVVLLSNGEIYGWGGCRKGQLGEDRKVLKICWRPERIILPFYVVLVVTGRDYTFCVDTQAEIHVLGDLKESVEASLSSSASELQLFSGWSSIFGLRDQRLLLYASGSKKQVPPLELPPLMSFAAGSEHSLSLTTDGKVIAWGWGEHGNCGSPVDSRGNVVERYNLIELGSAEDEVVVGVAAGCATSFVWTESYG